jgi:hypothetical protein
VSGYVSERGGYFELVGFDPAVEAQIVKFISIVLCPPVLGQCMVECMVEKAILRESTVWASIDSRHVTRASGN